MSLAVLSSRTVVGLDAIEVRVEVHLAGGMPSLSLVGRPDAEIRESRERVRAALVCSGYPFPDGRIIVNLAPADLPKASTRFDLPIALGILLAAGRLTLAHQQRRSLDARQRWLYRHVFAAELSLSGALVPSPAPLAVALAVARERSDGILIMPPADAALAARVPGVEVLAARSLEEVVQYLAGRLELPAAQASQAGVPEPYPCLADVRGQPAARRALEVAAAGEHSLLMCGPPGAGKSMLAQRLPGILPSLAQTAALEVAAVAGLAGQSEPGMGRRPFRAPHHSASRAALVGGGARPRPGEITLAHHGVLFLDEVAEFQRPALEALREPLETGRIVLVRAMHRVEYPARFQLVAAMNPCPCGWLGHPRHECRCTPDQVRRYQGKLSGPWLDRLDLQIDLPPLTMALLDGPAGESSAVVKQRVLAAHQRQQERQGTSNAHLGEEGLKRMANLADDAHRLWQRAGAQLAWSARASQRVLRVARTVADLDGSTGIHTAHVAEAIQLRCRAGQQDGATTNPGWVHPPAAG